MVLVIILILICTVDLIANLYQLRIYFVQSKINKEKMKTINEKINEMKRGAN